MSCDNDNLNANLPRMNTDDTVYDYVTSSPGENNITDSSDEFEPEVGTYLFLLLCQNSCRPTCSYIYSVDRFVCHKLIEYSFSSSVDSREFRNRGLIVHKFKRTM